MDRVTRGERSRVAKTADDARLVVLAVTLAAACGVSKKEVMMSVGPPFQIDVSPRVVDRVHWNHTQSFVTPPGPLPGWVQARADESPSRSTAACAASRLISGGALGKETILRYASGSSGGRA